MALFLTNHVTEVALAMGFRRQEPWLIARGPKCPADWRSRKAARGTS